MKARQSEHTEKLLKLTRTVSGEIAALPRFRLYSKSNPCGIVSFAHENLPSEEVATMLSERFGIATRGGLHCAPLIHKALGTAPDGLVRASFSPFQSIREGYALVRALKRIDSNRF